MLNVVRDGLNMLVQYGTAITAFIVAAAGCGLVIVDRLASREADLGRRMAVSLGVGGAVLSVFAFVLVIAGHFLPALLLPGSVAIFIFAAAVLVRRLWVDRSQIRPTYVLIAAAAIITLLVLRLAFLEQIILPPYSDSPVHYEIVVGFLHPGLGESQKLSLTTIFRDYYHFGFHSVAAWLSLIARLSPQQSISLLGQIFLMVVPLAVYALTHELTRSPIGSGFAALLAGIGWSMPAFAVNWGKYPAVSALAVMPAIIAAILLAARDERIRPVQIVSGAFLLLGASLMHTRMLVLGAFAAAAYFLSQGINPGEGMSLSRAARLALLYIISFLPLYRILLDFYGGIPVLIALAVLLPFAFQGHPRLSTGVFFFTFLLWLGVYIPFLPGENGRTLLDNQFVAIALFAPLSVMGGAGMAGMMLQLSMRPAIRLTAITVLLATVLLGFSPKHFYPDACCNYFRADDQNAFQWIRKNATDHSLFLISAFEEQGQSIGTDAGIWITPLTGRPANKVQYNTEWTWPAEMQEVCRMGASDIYIYTGGQEYSFDGSRLSGLTFVRRVFASGRTAIYRVTGCQPGG